MGTGIARPEQMAAGGAARVSTMVLDAFNDSYSQPTRQALFAASGFFATGLLAFYFYQFRAHKNDNQTCECCLVLTSTMPGSSSQLHHARDCTPRTAARK